MVERIVLRDQFLSDHGWGDVDCPLLAGDASFRKYYRLQRADEVVVLMDAPPPQENVEPFIKIAQFLLRFGFSAPQIHASDVENGFLLIEDLGDDTYTRLLENSHDEHALYRLATDVLVELHKDVSDLPDDLPAYDTDLLTTESLLLPDWWMKAALGDAAVTQDIRDDYIKAWQPAFARVEKQPQVLVLRDYHVDNLLLLPDRSEVAACGLLDFQDAVAGPGLYDLMSLLEDARRDIKSSLIEEMKRRYKQSFKGLDIEEFDAVFAILAAQRHAKVIGIFTRLAVRDDKPIYLKHLSRVWRLFERAITHPDLADLKMWIDTHIAKDKRGLPACLVK